MQLTEAHVAYRLAGHTIFPLDNHLTGVRFETCFEGEYFEQYYVILKLHGGAVEVCVFARIVSTDARRCIGTACQPSCR